MFGKFFNFSIPVNSTDHFLADRLMFQYKLLEIDDFNNLIRSSWLRKLGHKIGYKNISKIFELWKEEETLYQRKDLY